MPKHAVHLPFGQSQALTLDSVSGLESWADKNNRWTTRYTPQDLSDRFYTKLSTAQINGLKLVGVACAPMHTDVIANDTAMVCVPISGADNHSIINGKDYYYRPTEAAVYGPEGRRIGEGGERSVLFIDINKERLRRTLTAMTDNPSLRINLDDPAVLKLQASGVSFDQAIRSLCRLVDQFQGRQPLLDLSGVDESFYRIVGMMFRPDLLGSGAAPGTLSAPSHSLRRVCDFIVANLHRPLTLTDLEEVAGLSARALQLQFLKHFGCSPMAWLRNQRLEVAHQRLLHDAYGSVTQIALDVGFASASRFASAYKSRFGELPSVIRKYR